YRYRDGLYLNLTNRCPTACRFCVKFEWKMRYRGYDLTLARREPGVPELLAAVAKEAKARPLRELVFCGYGESTYRLAEMLELGAEARRRYPGARRRLNTVGLGDLIHGRPIAGDLPRGLDAVSISLNTADERQWAELHRPRPEFRERGFAAVLEFIRSCARAVPDTTVTAVAQPGVDLDACRRLAESLGARWRERELLDEAEAG
ncbi:MAG: radical SAM protein, partial [Elusimicrobia bacterium]|nr:radical SAM protein [Elusimicrobiota bacterium]